MGRWATALAVLTALVLAVFAQAPNPQARLTFSSESAACTEPALREAVAARLGYDPFVDQAGLAVDVKLVGTSTVKATLTVARPKGAPATRVLSGPGDCVGLTSAVSLALAVAIDPLVMTRPAPAPVVVAEPVKPVAPVDQPAAPAPAPVVVAPAAPVSEPVVVKTAITFAAGADIGQQPEGILGIRAGVRVGGKTLTGLLEGVVILPSRLNLAGGGAIDAFFVGGDAGVCAGASVFVGCALVRAGAMRFQGVQLTDVQSGWLPAFSAGVRAGLEWPKESVLAVQLAGELRVPITRLRVLVGDDLAWGQNWVIGSVQAGLIVRIP